jgi:hypothetical protein
MKTSVLYRISSGLLVLFAIGHQLGFRRLDPRWGVDSLVDSMKTRNFVAQGFSRTYWDFYTGFGIFVTVFLLFAAAIAWQLGGLTKGQLSLLPIICWGFAICFAGITYLSWKYFFIAPGIFSGLITLLLFLGAWLSGKS